METTIFNTAAAAEYITKHLLPAAAKPLTTRSVARFASLGKIPGAYMMKGEWCFSLQSMENYVQSVLGAKGRAPYRKRKQ
jgi:hypothetical protein